MPEFSYAIPEQPALDELARTDLLLDALAGRQPVDLDDSDNPDDEVLAALLEEWRDDLRWPPASALVSPEQAVTALHAGLAERGSTRRGLATIASVAATLLLLSGFGAVVVEARPGDTLYGLHAMFFDEPRVNEDQITLSAKAELAKVQQMIDKGQWDQAHAELAEVSSTVQSMNDGVGRHDLMDEVNLLNTRVRSRDPNATLPGSRTPAPNGTEENSVVAPAPKSQPQIPPVAPTPTTKPPTATKAPIPSSSPAPSPTSGHHHHHGHTPTPTTDAP